MKRICLLRMSALGDVTHALAVVRAIQTARPEIEITWIIGKLEHRLMQGLEGVRLVVFDKSAGLSAYRQLRRDLRGDRFDVLLHQQVALRANLAAALISAPLKVGYDRQRAKDGHGWFINQTIAAQSGQHVLDALLSFLPPIGIAIPDRPRWDLPIADSDLNFAEQHIAPAKPLLTLCPVSSHPRRNWRPERYAAVADHAIRQHNMQVIIAGGPSDFEGQFNASIEAAMTEQALNLTGRDTLKELAGLLGQSDLVLAPDTGPMHIANAMGTPVLGLHAASNARRSGAYDSLKWAADAYDEAARKYLGASAAELPFGQKIEREGVMDLLEVGKVTAILDRFMQQL